MVERNRFNHRCQGTEFQLTQFYPMSSDYDGLDQEYQLLLEENREMATKIEVLEMALQNMRSTDAEMVVRYNLMLDVFYSMCGHNEDLQHAKALAFADPEEMKKEIEADLSGDWMEIWKEDYPLAVWHGGITWEQVMETLNRIPKQLPPGQLKIVTLQSELDRLRQLIREHADNMRSADPVLLRSFIRDVDNILGE